MSQGNSENEGWMIPFLGCISMIFQIRYTTTRTVNLNLDFGRRLINIYVLAFGHIKVWQSYDKPEVKISRVITNGLCKLKINCVFLVFKKNAGTLFPKAFGHQGEFAGSQEGSSSPSSR